MTICWITHDLINQKDYVNKHPEVIILDPLDNVRKLLDRYRQYKLIDDSELAREGLYLFFDNLISDNFFFSCFTNNRLPFHRWCLYTNFCWIDDNGCVGKHWEIEECIR
jgi:hypothetical protein